MGTTLTGTTPQDTYDSLIKVTDNGPLSGSLKTLTDGLGNDSALALSTGAASVTGTLAVTAGANLATASGNVGIGTSSPQQKLHIANVAANSYALLGTSVNWGAADTNRIKIGSTGDTFTLGCDLRANTNYAGTTETSLGLWVTNGSSTMVEVVRATSNGLTFNGDTAAANALDDYEEGTWTPTIFGTGSGAATYTNQLGTYTKIGRQVVVQFFIDFQKNTLSGGTLQVRSLPFTAQVGLFPQGAILIDNLATALTNPLIQMGGGTTNADLIQNNGGTGNHAGLGVDTYLSAGTMTVRGTITYFV